MITDTVHGKALAMQSTCYAWSSGGSSFSCAVHRISFFWKRKLNCVWRNENEELWETYAGWSINISSWAQKSNLEHFHFFFHTQSPNENKLLLSSFFFRLLVRFLWLHWLFIHTHTHCNTSPPPPPPPPCPSNQKSWTAITVSNNSSSCFVPKLSLVECC